MGTVFDRLAQLEQQVNSINQALKEILGVDPNVVREVRPHHVKVITERIVRLMKAKTGDPVALQDIKRELPGVEGSQIHASLDRSGKFRKIKRGWYELTDGDGNGDKAE